MPKSPILIPEEVKDEEEAKSCLTVKMKERQMQVVHTGHLIAPNQITLISMKTLESHNLTFFAAQWKRLGAR
jgi:hypothetical protein